MFLAVASGESQCRDVLERALEHVMRDLHIWLMFESKVACKFKPSGRG